MSDSEKPRYLGQVFGNYHLVDLLGRGGFAEVYCGRHVHLNSLAAVKVLHSSLTSESFENFNREARIIASLDHPNIVRMLDFGIQEAIPFLVMNYAPNGSLRKQHCGGSQPALPIVVTYVKQVANALAYAHSRRLIHRDVKPENMLVGLNKIMLSDFGLAIGSQSTLVQSTQNQAGTLLYMAPEQLKGHPRYASDQYALGIVTYEWLCGSCPFQGTKMQIIAQHLCGTPPSLRGRVLDIPLGVEQVIMQALSKDPHERFPTITDFAAALERASLERRVYTLIAREPAGSTIQNRPAGPAIHKPQVRQHAASQYPAEYVLPPPPPAQISTNYRRYISFGYLILSCILGQLSLPTSTDPSFQSMLYLNILLSLAIVAFTMLMVGIGVLLRRFKPPRLVFLIPGGIAIALLLWVGQGLLRLFNQYSADYSRVGIYVVFSSVLLGIPLLILVMATLTLLWKKVQVESYY